MNGYFLTPVGPHQRSFAQWSLESTVDSGLRANQKQLKALGENLTSAFQAGISRLEQSQTQSAKLLQRELQYQTENIVGAISGQLCEVRWAIERHVQVSDRFSRCY